METIEAVKEGSELIKRNFIANLSHEIRSPMNGILGFSQLIRDYNISEEINEYAEMITKDGFVLLNLIDNIVDVARIDAGMMKTEIREFSINSVLSEVYNKFHLNPKVQDHTIDLRIIRNQDEVIVRSDEMKIKKIFINLVDNAIKFCEKGYVEFGYSVKDNNHPVYFVKDTGIGIPKENREYIYDRYLRKESVNTRRYNGAGLGLMLIKGYIDVLKGTIRFDSELGNGTTFFFTLP